MNSAKKTGIKSFLKGSGIALLLVVFVIIIGLSVFWKYLECYQKADASLPVKNAIEYIKSGDFSSAVKLIDKDNNVFVSEDHFEEYIHVNFPEGFSSLNFTGSDKLYKIFNSDKEIFSLTVAETNEQVGFGFNTYSIASVSVPKIAPISIYVPKDAKVFVDGVEVLSSTAVSCKMDFFNSKLSEEQCADMYKYVVEGFIVYPEIAVTHDVESLGENNELIVQNTICKPLETSDPYNLFYIVEGDLQQNAELIKKATEASKNYSSFMLRGMSVNYLLRYVYDQSEFYNEMKNFDNSDKKVQYGISYSDDIVNSLYFFDDTHAVVNLKINRAMRVSGEPVSETKQFSVYMYLVDEQWKVVNLEMF